MENKCRILPTVLEYRLFGYDDKKYTEGLYKIFKRDFLDGEVIFQGKRVDIIHEAYFEGKERSFWHIISSGGKDVDREIDVARCEKISWVKSLIEDEGKCDKYKLWVRYHDKTKKNRYYIWCTEVDYMVVLEERGEYYKLITAYNVEEYSKKAYNKNYESYIKTKTPTD